MRITPESVALDRARATHDHGDGPEEDLEIQPQRPLANVSGIQRHDLLEVHDVAAPIHLPQAGDSRFRPETPEVASLVVLQIGLDKRPWPTSDISPRSTFQSCGSSSRLQRRSQCPTRETRGSARILNSRG